MTSLQEKYAGVISAAQSAGISNLKVTEQNGVLYVSGSAATTAAKDAVWNAVGVVDPEYKASDINVDVQVSGLTPGATLRVNTENSNLNIRQAPSTEATVVGKAGRGDTVALSAAIFFLSCAPVKRISAAIACPEARSKFFLLKNIYL